MKKLLALLLCVLLVVSMLAACGNKDENDDDDKSTKSTTSETKADETKGTEPKGTEPTPTQPQGTEPSQTQKPSTGNKQEAAVGTILDTPEVTFDLDKNENVYVLFNTKDETGKDTQMEIAVKEESNGTSLLYVTDGMLRGEEVLYEMTEAGDITKYARGIFDDNFSKVTATQDALEQETMEILDLLLMMLAPVPSTTSGVKFEKTDDIAFSLVGDVYTYNVLENGNVELKIHVHKETGIVTDMKDAQGNTIYSVMDLSLTEIPIPDYK